MSAAIAPAAGFESDNFSGRLISIAICCAARIEQCHRRLSCTHVRLTPTYYPASGNLYIKLGCIVGADAVLVMLFTVMFTFPLGRCPRMSKVTLIKKATRGWLFPMNRRSPACSVQSTSRRPWLYGSPPANHVIDDEKYDGAYQRTQKPCGLTRVIQAQCLTSVRREQRTGNTNQRRDEKSRRITSRSYYLGQQSHYETDQYRPDYAHRGDLH
jgi:hypothetical protein